MLQAEEFPAGVANLDSALGCVARRTKCGQLYDRPRKERTRVFTPTLEKTVWPCLSMFGKKGKTWSKALMNKNMDSALGKNEQNPQPYANDFVTVDQMESNKSQPRPIQKNCRPSSRVEVHLRYEFGTPHPAMFTVQNVWPYVLLRRKIKMTPEDIQESWPMWMQMASRIAKVASSRDVRKPCRVMWQSLRHLLLEPQGRRRPSDENRIQQPFKPCLLEWSGN